MTKSRIQRYIDEHEGLRTKGINFVVSENYISEAVRSALASDLSSRYDANWYGGSTVARKIIAATEDLAKELFGAKHAFVSSLSGNMCDLAALFAFSNPGDKVAMLPFMNGGYPFGFTKFNRTLKPLPAHDGTFDIDEEAAEKMLLSEKIPLTILGASCIPFPHPVEKISEFVKKADPSGICAYDGSHVLGLIACNAFQNPLKEGADLLIGSTHKTFFGPQGGIILTNRDDCADAIRTYLGFDLDTGLGLVDNIHVNRVAALGIAIEEMLADRTYGSRVIENAKALAAALYDSGVPVRFKERGYTESHQTHLDLDMTWSENFCHDLESVGIFIDIGGRVGTGEVTHRGMGISEMKKAASLIAAVFHEGPKESIREAVFELTRTAGAG